MIPEGELTDCVVFAKETLKWIYDAGTNGEKETYAGLKDRLMDKYHPLIEKAYRPAERTKADDA